MASRRPPFIVYLAGPVRGCNATQARKWREQVKARAAGAFRCLDPLEDPVDEDAPPYKLVNQDLQAIESADGVLAYMWRESIGTAIGLVHARTKGRLVVVVDPNHIENPFLDFYADVVVTTLSEGIQAMRDLLKASTFTVLKHRGRGEQPFSRAKLVESVRGAAREAGRNDITVPALVLRRVTDALAGTTRRIGRQLTTSDIERHILEALETLEADVSYTSAVAGVRECWKRSVSRKGGTRHRAATTTSQEMTDGGHVRLAVHGSKSHSSIWGRHIAALSDVPGDARAVLQGMANAGNVVEIRLNTMGQASKRSRVGVHLRAPDARGGIAGYLVDPAGERGRKQSFTLRVLRSGHERTAFAAMRSWLSERGAWIDG